MPNPAHPYRKTKAAFKAGLRLYPRAYRQRFGSEMEETFAAGLQHVHHQQGRAAAYGIGALSLIDVAGQAIRERVTPSEQVRHADPWRGYSLFFWGMLASLLGLSGYWAPDVFLPTTSGFAYAIPPNELFGLISLFGFIGFGIAIYRGTQKRGVAYFVPSFLALVTFVGMGSLAGIAYNNPLPSEWKNEHLTLLGFFENALAILPLLLGHAILLQIKHPKRLAAWERLLASVSAIPGDSRASQCRFAILYLGGLLLWTSCYFASRFINAAIYDTIPWHSYAFDTLMMVTSFLEFADRFLVILPPIAIALALGHFSYALAQKRVLAPSMAFLSGFAAHLCGYYLIYMPYEYSRYGIGGHVTTITEGVKDEAFLFLTSLIAPAFVAYAIAQLFILLAQPSITRPTHRRT